MSPLPAGQGICVNKADGQPCDCQEYQELEVVGPHQGLRCRECMHGRSWHTGERLAVDQTPAGGDGIEAILRRMLPAGKALPSSADIDSARQEGLAGLKSASKPSESKPVGSDIRGKNARQGRQPVGRKFRVAAICLLLDGVIETTERGHVSYEALGAVPRLTDLPVLRQQGRCSNLNPNIPIIYDTSWGPQRVDEMFRHHLPDAVIVLERLSGAEPGTSLDILLCTRHWSQLSIAPLDQLPSGMDIDIYRTSNKSQWPQSIVIYTTKHQYSEDDWIAAFSPITPAPAPAVSTAMNSEPAPLQNLPGAVEDPADGKGKNRLFPIIETSPGPSQLRSASDVTVEPSQSATANVPPSDDTNLIKQPQKKAQKKKYWEWAEESDTTDEGSLVSVTNHQAEGEGIAHRTRSRSTAVPPAQPPIAKSKTTKKGKRPQSKKRKVVIDSDPEQMNSDPINLDDTSNDQVPAPAMTTNEVDLTSEREESIQPTNGPSPTVPSSSTVPFTSQDPGQDPIDNHNGLPERQNFVADDPLLDRFRLVAPSLQAELNPWSRKHDLEIDFDF